MLRAVVLDMGETLIDETRSWEGWADWLGIPRLTFLGTLGAVAARGEPHRRVFELLAPGFDLEAERAARRATGHVDRFEPADLYPDAAPAIAALRRAGFWVGVAGNQPEWAEDAFAALGVEVDGLASSARWGVAKPSPEFFARVVELAGVGAEHIAYVGDRIDNDVAPARAAGMCAVFLKRGPWGHAHALWPEVACADLAIDTLEGLAARLRDWKRA